MKAVPTVEAIVLAAGAGRRLGLPKAALRLRGQWMLPVVIRTLRAGGVRRVVLTLSETALDAIADLGDPGADIEVRNPDPDAGRTGSLQCALARTHPDAAVLVHPCDMPLVQPTTVRTVIHAWRQRGAREDALVRPVSSGRRGGHPLLIGPAWREEILHSAADRPLRELLRLRPGTLHDVRVADDPGAFLDVDTPEQLALLESLLDR